MDNDTPRSSGTQIKNRKKLRNEELQILLNESLSEDEYLSSDDNLYYTSHNENDYSGMPIKFNKKPFNYFRMVLDDSFLKMVLEKTN